MDSYGKLQLCWQSGPLPLHPSQLSHLTEHSLVYNAGASINRMDLNTGRTSRFGTDTGPISCLAVYRYKPYVVYAQVSLEPLLTLLDETGRVVGRFQPGAELEYTALAFSHDGKCLLATSGIPDYKLFLWNVESFELVCSTEIGAGNKVKEVAVDPFNMCRVSLITEKGELFLYKIEKCGSFCSKFTRIIIDLPNRECSIGYQKEATSSLLTQPDVDSTLHNSLLSDSEFYAYRVDPSVLDSAGKSGVVAQAWAANSQLYVLTTDSILLLEGDTGKYQLLHRISDPHTSYPSTSQRDRDETSTHSPVARVAFTDNLLGDTDILTVSESHPRKPVCMAVTSAGLVIGFDDGSVRVLDSSAQFATKQELKLDETAVCLLFPPDSSSLTAVGESGAVFSIRISTGLVYRHSAVKRHESLATISLIPLTDERELVVTANSDGEILIWEETGQLVSTLQLGQPCTKLVGLKSAPLLLTGTSSGYMFVYSLNDPSQPKLLLTKRLHRDSITELATDSFSQVVVSCSGDRHLFILDARLSTEMEILCRLELESEVSSISIYTPNYRDTLYIALLGGVNDVITFQFNPSWPEGDPNHCYSDPNTRLLNKSTASYLVSSIEPYALTGLCVAGPSSLYSVNRVSGELVRLLFSIRDDGEEVDKAFRVEGEYNGHLVTGARFREVENASVLLSPTNEWVCTAFRDGRVQLYKVLEPEVGCMCATVSHYTRDNILGVTFSGCGQNIYCLSKCGGGIACVRLEGSDTLIGRQKTQAAIASKRMREKAVGDSREKELVFLQSLPQIGTLAYADTEGATTLRISLVGVELDTEADTWLDVRNRVREEEERVAFSSQKEALMNGLSELRETVLQMIEQNQGLPDIEQLERTDFVLDLDGQRDMKQRQEESVERKEKEIHLQNLAKIYLTEQLKDTCWETMTVPGKTVYSFNGKVEVCNYPLCKLSEKERKLTQAATERLDIVKECGEAREDLEGDIDPSYYLKQVSHVGEKLEDDDEDLVERESDAAGQGKESKEIDTECIEGRRGEKHGGLVVPSQFNTRSLLSYRDQVLVLHHSVEKVKQHFNQEFDEVLKLKHSETTRSNERCARIGQIMYDLKTKHDVTARTNSGMLKLHPYEEPEKLLEVKDSEVELQRYETDAERKQRVEQTKIEEERILAEMGDRWRERALDMMMAGKLEIDTEDELFKELVDPDFLAVADLTGDPELQAKKKEWEVHVSQVREERDKHKRGLESEMSKLEQGIVEGCQKVDDRIQLLYRVKIDYDKVVYQEELKILSLIAAEMFTQELIKQEEFLLCLLERSREHKQHASGELTQTGQHLEKFTETYSSSQIDDKNLDRNFKKEHSDLEPYVDALYKIFRKRPRVQKKPILPTSDSSLSIFAARPPSPTQALKDALEELDSFTHAPEGVEKEGWEKVVRARRQKIDSEQRMKKEAIDLAEMQAYFQELEREDEHAHTDTESIIREIDRVRGVKNRLYLNIQVQLLVKQGQVEVENGSNFLTDHSGSILIWKQTVDELNKQVKLLGKEKLERMRQNMDFKRGIHLLEWEHRKLRMEAEDLQKKAKEIQTLKLTKEIQLRMQETDKIGDTTKADMDVLERTLEHKKLAHDSRISTLNSQLKDLEREISKRKDNNQTLDVDLQDTAVSEAERARLVERERPDPQELAKKRVRGVMLRRRMLDMAKSQAREINALRSELERLRLKTFPALLQLD